MLRTLGVGRRRALAVLGCSLLAVGLTAADLAASKRVRKPTREDLATVWIGGGGESTEFLRLDLDGTGAGVLTMQYLPDGPATAYRVRSTVLADYAIRLDVETVDQQSQRIEVTGEAVPGLLRLSLRGRSPDWSRRIELQRYDELLRRIKVVTDKADATRASR